MPLSLTADGIRLDETLQDAPPLRARQYSLAALDAAGPLFAFVSGGYSLAALLAPTSIADPALSAARRAFAALSRAHAHDIFADAGQQAQAWPLAFVDALQTLRLLIGMAAGNAPPAAWTVQVPRFSLAFEPQQHSAAKTPPPSAAPALQRPPASRALTMDEVLISSADVPDAQLVIQATRLYPLLGQSDLPTLTLATGAFLVLRLLPALTGYTDLALADPVQGWRVELATQ